MDSETDNFREARAYFRWKPAAWLRVTGEDAMTFLQGQFTNDLRELPMRGAVYGLWLNHKGRVLADSFVVAGGPGEYWVGSYHCAANIIQERLAAFVIADDVVIEDQTADWSGVTIFGSRSDLQPRPTLSGFVFPGRRATEPHDEYVLRNDQRSEILAKLSSVPERDAVAMERIRITAAIPSVPADIGSAELPNEGGLDEVAISYTKGCYLGQEVMARLKSMGQVRRRLLRVHGMGPLPILPASIFTGDRRIGELRTAVSAETGYIGLALLNLLNLKPETILTFGPNAGATVELSATP